jgi:hypothetical protein
MYKRKFELTSPFCLKRHAGYPYRSNLNTCPNFDPSSTLPIPLHLVLLEGRRNIRGTLCLLVTHELADQRVLHGSEVVLRPVLKAHSIRLLALCLHNTPFLALSAQKSVPNRLIVPPVVTQCGPIVTIPICERVLLAVLIAIGLPVAPRLDGPVPRDSIEAGGLATLGDGTANLSC